MKFGIALESFTPPGKTPSPQSLFEISEMGESLGFESVWVWDHLLLGTRKVFPVLDSLTTLAAIGSRTTKIKVGTSVLVLGLRNPIVVAKVASTIQCLTKGRLTLGVSSGWYEKEFQTFGVPFEKRGKIFEEKFSLIRSLLSESDVTYSNPREGINLEHASMEPKCSRIPFLVGGYSDAVLARTGRMSDGWISYYYTPKDYAESWRKVSSSAKEAGRDPDKLRRVDIVPLAISKSIDEGDRLARDFTAKYMDLPKNTRCTMDSAVKGTADQCIEQIREYQKAGVDELVFIPSFYDKKQIELAGKEILPFFKGEDRS